MTLGKAIETNLVSIDQWPESGVFDSMYILGGRKKSQKFKFEVASRIYSQEICRNIMFLSVEGIAAYSPELQRSLTNDEWSFLKMGKLGIQTSDVMALSIEEGFFGTMNEAKNVARFVQERGYKNILLIAAPYHSKRVRICFEKYLKGYDVDLAILSSGETVYLRSLILEWLKLKIYQILLLI